MQTGLYLSSKSPQLTWVSINQFRANDSPFSSWLSPNLSLHIFSQSGCEVRESFFFLYPKKGLWWFSHKHMIGREWTLSIREHDLKFESEAQLLLFVYHNPKSHPAAFVEHHGHTIPSIACWLFVHFLLIILSTPPVNLVDQYLSSSQIDLDWKCLQLGHGLAAWKAAVF
jgi:hypothetical protein